MNTLKGREKKCAEKLCLTACLPFQEWLMEQHSQQSEAMCHITASEKNVQ